MDEEVIVKLESGWEPKEEGEFVFLEARGDEDGGGEEDEEDNKDLLVQIHVQVQPKKRKRGGTKKGRKKKSRETKNMESKLRRRMERARRTAEEEEREREQDRIYRARVKAEKDKKTGPDETEAKPKRKKQKAREAGQRQRVHKSVFNTEETEEKLQKKMKKRIQQAITKTIKVKMKEAVTETMKESVTETMKESVTETIKEKIQVNRVPRLPRASRGSLLALERKRARCKEEMRRRRSRQTEEQRREENQRKIIRRIEKKARMTEEELKDEKTKNNLNYLQRRATMTEEELAECRRKKREDVAKRKANKPKIPTTEEMKARKREYYRQKMAKMTPEQKARNREYGRLQMRKVRERLKAGDPEKFKAYMKKVREQEKLRRQAKRAAGKVQTKPKRNLKKKSKGRFQDVSCGLSKQARAMLQRRNRRAMESPEERVKRLLLIRLKSAKRRLRKKLTEGKASPERIEREMEDFEANWKPKNRFLRSIANPKPRSHKMQEELAKFGIKLEDSQPKIDVKELVKIASTTVLEDIKVAKRRRVVKQPKPVPSSPVIKTPPECSQTQSQPLLPDFQIHSQLPPTELHPPNESQQPTSQTFYYHLDNPVLYCELTDVSGCDAVSSYSNHQQCQSELGGPASPVSTSDFEENITTPLPAAPQPPAQSQPSDKPRGKRGPQKGCKMRRNPNSNKGAKPGPKGTYKSRIVASEGKKMIMCESCGRSYSCSKNLSQHKLILHNPHFNPETGACRLCEKDPTIGTFATGTEYYRKHWLEVHRNREKPKKLELNPISAFICEECGRVCETNEKLYFHIYFSHRFKRGTVQCLQCEDRFKEKEDLKEHVKVNHPASYFPCEGCGALKYSWRSRLIHYGTCEEIKKMRDQGKPEQITTKKENAIKEFVKVLVKCEVCVEEMLLDQLTTHYWHVHGVKEERIKCSKCSKRFTRRSTFMMHMMIVHGIVNMDAIREDINKYNVSDRSKVEVKNINGRSNSKKVGKRPGKQRGRKKRKISSDEELVESETEEELNDFCEEEQETPKRTSGRRRGSAINITHNNIEKEKRLVISIVRLTSEQIMSALGTRVKEEKDDTTGENETEPN